MAKTSTTQDDNQLELLNSWEAAGYQQLTQLRLYDPKHQQVIHVGDNLPSSLSLSAACLVFLSTLSGQSKQTHKTYRVGCRRLMWFIYSTDRGLPQELTVFEMSPSVLEDFYLWLVDSYGKQNRATIGAYLAGVRNLFDYLASRELTPGGVQYSRLIARLGKMQGRASYKTPDTLRIKGRQTQIEQVAQLAAATYQTDSAMLNPPSEQASDSVNVIATSPLANEPQVVEPAQPYSPTTLEKVVTDPQQAKVAGRRTRKVHNPTEIARQELEKLRDRALILTLFTTGMRREEVTLLDRPEMENLIKECGTNNSYVKSLEGKENTSEPTQRQVYELIITGKGQKERVVYFDQITLQAIEQYLARRGKDIHRPLFLQHHRGRDKVKPGASGENYRVGDRTVWVAVKKYAAQMGLELKPHDFRHNLATTLLNAGAQLSEVQDILGHASPTTTKQIYAHYDKGHLKEAFARFGKSAADLV